MRAVIFLLFLVSCHTEEETHCFQCIQTRQGQTIATFDKCITDQQALDLAKSMTSATLDPGGTWIYTTGNCKRK